MAISFAALGLPVSVAATIYDRQVIGEGWFFLVFIQALFSAIYAIFLIFSYNGRGWVRYFMLIIYLIGFGRAAVIDYRLFFDPFIALALLLAVLATTFWFQPSTNRWYKNVRFQEPA